MRVLLGVRLPDAGDLLAGGASGDEMGAGAEFDDQRETAEDGSPGPGHDAQGLAVVFRDLPPCALKSLPLRC